MNIESDFAVNPSSFLVAIAYMKLLFNQFSVVRSLGSSTDNPSFHVRDAQTREDLVLKVLRKGQFELNREALSRRYSWLETQCHPNLGRVLDARVGPRHELYWTRKYYRRHLNEVSLTHVRDLVSAVAFLHSNGYIHGRIRPSNVLEESETLQLVDARPECRHNRPLTAQDIHFTAPEIFRGAEHTVATDLYSVGTTLYTLLLGRTVFEDLDEAALRSKYLVATPRRLADSNVLQGPVATAIDGLITGEPVQRLSAFKSLQSLLGIETAVVGRSGFVGRDVELKAIQEHAFNNIQRLAVISVEAASGLGKTRLLEELERRSHFYNVDFVSVECSNSDRELEPIRRLLIRLLKNRYPNQKDHLQFLAEYGNALSEFLQSSTRLPPVGDSALQLFENDLIASLAELSRIRPVVMGLDDAHNATSQTVSFLHQLVLRQREINGSLLLTNRNTSEVTWLTKLIADGVVDNHRVLCLLPLSYASSLTIVNQLTKGVAYRDRILKNAHGSPYFLVHTAQLTGKPTLESNGTSEWLQETLRNLPLNAFQLIRLLSVLDGPIAVNDARRALDLTEEDLWSAMCDAFRCDLVYTDGDSIDLRHAYSLRKSIYAGISTKKRIGLHYATFQSLTSSKSTVPIQTLAVHAFRGRCYEVAVGLCIKSASILKLEGRLSEALQYYVTALKASIAVGRDLSNETRLDIADCYARIGRQKDAKHFYELLAESLHRTSESGLQPVLYRKIAETDLKTTNTEQLQLHSLALSQLGPESEMRIHSHLCIAQTFIRMGKLEQARAALEEALSSQLDNSRYSSLLIVTRGLICLNGGLVREANAFLKKIPLTRSVFSMGVMANLALSCEYMGQLKSAEAYLQRLLTLAVSSGYAFLQVVTPNNLGSVLRKEGRFQEAEQQCACALRRFEQFRAKDKTFPVEALSMINCDTAVLMLEVGRYSSAVKYLRESKYSDQRSAMDNMFSALAECDLNVRIGAPSRAKGRLREIRALPLGETPFFRIELALLMASLGNTSHTEIDELRSFIALSSHIGSLHQSCRLSLVLSGVELTTDLESAKAQAEQAFKIAKKNGYRPLLAQAMMLRGLASGHHREKEHWLTQGFKLASEIGMPELVAESAYQIGDLLVEQGNFATGKEYLLKSTAITSELAEEIPSGYRSKYLSKPWRRKARKRLDECVQHQAAGLAPIQPLALVPQRESQFFSTLYRLSIIANAAARIDGFISEFLQVLDESLRRPLLLVLTHDDKTSWHSNRMDLTDDLKKQVLATAARGKDRPLFDYRDRARTKGTIAWIPLRSAHYMGGIYVARREHETMAEREIEFLSVLGSVVSNALDQIGGRAYLAPPVMERKEFHGIVGKSRAIAETCRQVEIAAGNNATVLIEGETGAGKEVVARAIHKLGNRATSPFIAVDCGALPEGLIESELFGSKRGSYTGATADRAGLFEAANHGTLFLDEISNTNPSVQAKLLRVLQEREVRRVGETRGRPIDVRLIAATNRSLTELVNEGAFRQDLLYRLNVLHLTVPALRNRREDIPLLAAHFLRRLNSVQKTAKVFGPTAFDSLAVHSFPGNVRELQNAVERSFFSAKGTMISTIPIEHPNSEPVVDEVKAWFKDLSEGRKDFWKTIHERYKRRDIPREKIVALVDLGLRATHGSYTDLASLFRVGNRGYRRLMDFLRRNECLLDFRPYRKNIPPAS